MKSYGVTIQMKTTEQYFHNMVLIVFVFCILQNEILNSFRILTWPFLRVNGEWVNDDNGIWNSANLFFGWRVFAAVTVVISSLMLLEPFCLPEYKIIGVLQHSYLSKHVQNVLGLE